MSQTFHKAWFLSYTFGSFIIFFHKLELLIIGLRIHLLKRADLVIQEFLTCKGLAKIMANTSI